MVGENGERRFETERGRERRRACVLLAFYTSRKPVFCSTSFLTRRRSLPLSVLPTPSNTEKFVTCDLATITCGGTISSSSSSCSFALSHASDSSTTFKTSAFRPLLHLGHTGMLTGADWCWRTLPTTEAASLPSGTAIGLVALAAVATDRC